MAEGRPAPSLKKLARPKSSQSEKRPHKTKGKEVETPALQLSEAQQEPPAAALQTTSSEDREQYLDTVSTGASELSLLSISDYQEESDQPQTHPSSRSPSPPTLTFQKWNEPTIKVFRSGSSVKVTTEYRGKLSPEELELLERSSTAIPLEKPPPRTDRARSVPILWHTDKAYSKARGENVVYGSVRAIKQRRKTVSIPSVVLAREAATKLYYTQTFLLIKQLTVPPEVSGWLM